MNALEIYFQNNYKDDYKEVFEVEDLLRKVLPTFIYSFNKEKKEWPYIINLNKRPRYSKNKKSYSTSTNSMIISMMRLALGIPSKGYIFPKIKIDEIFSGPFLNNFKPNKNYCSACEDRESGCGECSIKKIWKDIIDKGTQRYTDGVKHFREKLKKITHSNTYGDNDPLSLLWCAEILGLPEDDKILAAEIIKEMPRRDVLNFDEDKFNLNNHSFVALKFLQLRLMLGAEVNKKEKFEFFEKTLHLNLSYNDIPDSRFDPAELAFSLEGALACGDDFSLSSEAISRAISVIMKSQDNSPYWRPINPLYATKQGQILLPLSVEVANSLLRICAKLDVSDYKISPFVVYGDMFKRYFRWLSAQIGMVNIPNPSGDPIPCWGWESEHVGGSEEIHLFQTSEILCFLINYRHMLKDRIARQSLEASGLKVDASYSGNIELAQDAKKDIWKDIKADYEPLLELPDASPYKIFYHIEKHFLWPENESQRMYSMLLYGPPGTGKTTIAEGIARAMGYKLITVTPSDFIAGGSAQLEARAKAIFQCLEEQANCVILFDEIDQFLLNRESKSYQEQESIFQLMTPGMLPKLNGLRKKGKSIFIIATNFEDHIDSAIKRVGRIDIRYPLMPPAHKRRVQIVKKLFPRIDSLPGFNESSVQKVAESTKRCTYNDIKALSRSSYANVEELEKQASVFSSIPSTHYESRMKENMKPSEEFVLFSLIQFQKCHDDGFELGEGIKDYLEQYQEYKNQIKQGLRCSFVGEKLTEIWP